jgi:hypothetical protein
VVDDTQPLIVAGRQQTLRHLSESKWRGIRGWPGESATDGEIRFRDDLVERPTRPKPEREVRGGGPQVAEADQPSQAVDTANELSWGQTVMARWPLAAASARAEPRAVGWLLRRGRGS